MTIGERIVFLRDERGLSQKELAKALHITAATLSRYENDIYQPKMEFLCEMCKILDTSSDFLLGFTTDYERKPSGNASFPPLNTDEKNLLNMYRNLSDENRNRIQERLLTLIELQKL